MKDSYQTIRDTWSFREVVTANVVLNERDYASEPVED